MKNSFIAILLCIFFSPTFAQYSSSGGLLTVNTGLPITHPQDNSVGALGPSTRGPDNRPVEYYAISNQYSSSTGNQCWRKIRFFKGQGNLVATSSNYSHDHSGKTKIIFDPNNGKVVYALYQERYSSTGGPAINQTFVKRFELNPVTNTIVQSNRFHVFNFTKDADFVVAPNGDLLVGSPMTDGAIHIKVIRYTSSNFVHLNTFITSQAGEAFSVPLQGFTWPLSMDMKGNTIVIAHGKGSYTNPSIKIKTGSYIPPTAPNTGGLPLIHEYNFSGQKLYPANALHQSVGIRANGDILYLRNLVGANNWNLIKVDPTTYATTTLRSGSGAAHIVASENNMAFLGRIINGLYKIEKFNDHDVLEHTYNLAWQLDQGLKHLTVRDCKILSCGREETYTQYHELYSCSDCNNGTPTAHADFTNQLYDVPTSTYYGTQQVPVYCKWSDVIIDASGSSCEDAVYLRIREINPTTWAWSTGSSLFNGWICNNCTAAHDIKPIDYVTPSAGYNAPYRYYLATIDVGPAGTATHKLFKFKYCAKPNGPKLKAAFKKTTDQNTIYPNPTNGILNVPFKDIKNNSDIQVLNALGQVVFQTSTQGQETLELDLSNYESGLYLIHITTGDEKRIEKVIKQ